MCLCFGCVGDKCEAVHRVAARLDHRSVFFDLFNEAGHKYVLKFGRDVPLIQGSAPAAGVLGVPGDVGAPVRSDGIGKDLLTVIGYEPPLNGRW